MHSRRPHQLNVQSGKNKSPIISKREIIGLLKCLIADIKNITIISNKKFVYAHVQHIGNVP